MFVVAAAVDAVAAVAAIADVAGVAADIRKCKCSMV